MHNVCRTERLLFSNTTDQQQPNHPAHVISPGGSPLKDGRLATSSTRLEDVSYQRGMIGRGNPSRTEAKPSMSPKQPSQKKKNNNKKKLKVTRR